jgi:hypothetical protein
MTQTAEEFTNLPLAMLIAAPLTASGEASKMLANITADFIREIGFLPPDEDSEDPNAVGAIRMARFGFTRPSPTVPGQVDQVVADFPLISMVSVPALQIKTVDVTFEMEVRTASASVESSDSSISGSLEVRQRWGSGSAKLNIAGSVSSHKENTRSSDTSAKYSIAIHAVDPGMSEGLQRVMDILNAAITAPPTPLPAPE